MSTPPDQPTDSGAEAAARIGSILASAEREVARIFEESQRTSSDDVARVEVRTRVLDERTVELNAREADLESRSRHVDTRTVELDGRATELDRRATELADLTAGLLSTAVNVQSYARRLAALHPLTADGPSLDEIVADLPKVEAPLRPAVDARAADPAPADPAEQPPANRPRTATATPPAEPDAPRPSTPAALRAVDQLEDDDRWNRPANTTAAPAPAADASPVDSPAPSDSPAPAADAPPAVETPVTENADETEQAPQHLSAAPESPVEEDEELPIVAGSKTTTDAPEKLDSARLVALSMAAEGRSRDEVESHLRDTLGIIEHAALIDYVFGGSTPSSVVPSWPPRRRRRT